MLLRRETKQGPLSVIWESLQSVDVISLIAASVLAYYFVNKMSTSITQDTMQFALKKNPTKPKDPTAFRQLWVGELPEEAQDLVDLLVNSYDHPDIAVPKGTLLYGPPGTGKTHFARLLADFSQCSFFYASASQFEEILVGRGSQRVRNLFAEAVAATQPSWSEQLMHRFMGSSVPCRRSIIFIDEIDALGDRNTPYHATQNTISQILTCMDGLTSYENVIVLAATNNIHLIDNAVKRSGRFDRIINFHLPSKTSREALIRHYLPDKSFVTDEYILRLAERTVGFSSADIKTMMNEAKLKTWRSQRTSANIRVEIKDEDLESACGTLLKKKTLEVAQNNAYNLFNSLSNK